jgi:hypothetical protein
MACVDAKLSPVHDGACAHFHAVPGDGYAHHPYERDAAPWIPSAGQSHAGWAQMGDLDRVQSLIDRLVEMHRLAPGVRELWLTEQGYESNAELNDRRWSEAQQAQLNAVSEYLAWRSPSVQSFSQFLLHDSRTRQTLALRRRSENPTATLSGTWTTGLERENGVPKPALWMFRSPVVARLLPARAADPADVPLSPEALRQPVSWIEVWGRARPVRAPTLVMVRVGGFTTRCTVTDSNGIFDIKAAVPYGTRPRVGFSWLAARGGWQASPTTVPIAFPLRQL